MDDDVLLEDALAAEGVLLRPIVGDSMMPMLDQKKDTVKIVPARGVLKKYDLPLYKRPNGQYVLHRVIGVREGYYVICGDNRWQKERVPFEWIVGVTEGFYKNGKYVSCADETYLQYVRRRCRGRIFRAVRELLARFYRKLKAVVRRVVRYGE